VRPRFLVGRCRRHGTQAAAASRVDQTPLRHGIKPGKRRRALDTRLFERADSGGKDLLRQVLCLFTTRAVAAHEPVDAAVVALERLCRRIGHPSLLSRPGSKGNADFVP
jgi:hypothetical protein